VSFLSDVFYIEGAGAACQGLATNNGGSGGNNGAGIGGGTGRFKELEALWSGVLVVLLCFANSPLAPV